MRRLTALIMTLVICFSLVSIYASATDEMWDMGDFEVYEQPAFEWCEQEDAGWYGQENADEGEFFAPPMEMFPEFPETVSEAAAVSYIAVEPSEQTVTLGETVFFSAAVFPENAGNRDVSWSSSDASVAAVTADGTVTGIGAGTAFIIASAADESGVTGSAVVYVKDPAESGIVETDAAENDTEENDTEENDTEENDTEENDTEENDTEENDTEENDAEKKESENIRFTVTLPEGFKGENSVEAGQTYSFTFLETPADAYLHNYLFDAVMVRQGEARVPVGVKQLDDASFLIVDLEAWEPIAVTGDLIIVGKGSEGRAFSITADSSELSRAWETLYFPANEEGEILPGVYGQEEPYTVLIRHEEERRGADGEERNEEDAEYIYSMPLMKLRDEDGVWQDYFGYYLETVTDDPEYAKLWKLCIPGEDIRGDILISADRAEKTPDAPETGTTGTVRLSFRDSFGNPEENIEGLSVFSHEAFAAEEENAGDYYFSMKNDRKVRNVKYSVSGGEEREPEAVGESIYKIPKGELTADIVVTVKDPSVPETYSVTRQGSGKGEEIMIELLSDTVPAGQDYIFHVRPGRKSFAEVTVSVTISGNTYPLGELQTDSCGDYLAVTVPASMITGDILITAECRSEVKCKVTFEDAYYADSRYRSYRFTAFKIVLVSDSNGEIKRTLLDDHIDPNTRSISIELSPHETLCFEVVMPRENSYGKYYTDQNTSCYLYDFTGSVMGDETLGGREYIQDTYIYTLDSCENTEPDGTFHTDYTVGDVSGDVTIKLKPLMKKFGVTVNGSGVNEVTLVKSTASYRTNLSFGKTDDTVIDSVTIGGQKISLNRGYRYAVDSAGQQNTNSFVIDGSYITGDIAIYATRTGSDAVPVVNRKSSLVSSAGTEYSLGMSEFRRIGDGKCIYLITAKGDSADFMAPCYDGHEMLYFDPYGAFVWLTVSDENSDDFYENAKELFDELSEEEILGRMQKRVTFGVSTLEEEISIIRAVETYLLAGDLNGDYVVDDEDVALARELYMNSDTEKKNESLGLYLLADVNRSNKLDMRDIAKIKKLAEEEKERKKKQKAKKEERSDDGQEEEEIKRSYTLEVCADGEKKIEVSPTDEIRVEWKLLRTDREKDEDAAVAVLQDELFYDGDLLELLEDTELAEGVEMTAFRMTAEKKDASENDKNNSEEEDEEEKNIQCISLSYLAEEEGPELDRENVLGVFRFKVIGGDTEMTVSHNNAFVIASDCETEYPCELIELDVKSKEERSKERTD